MSTNIPLYERLTYDTLFRLSDPKRVLRSHTVKGPPLEMDTYQDTAYYAFNFKSNPSTTGLRHHGYIKFFKPKNTNKPLQHIDCLVDCTCFGPDTPVLMGNGTYKAISEIVPGDSVYTHKGRIKLVTKNTKRAVKPEEAVYRLSLAGHPGSFIVTGEHPFYALRGNDNCLCGCGEKIWNADSTRCRNNTWSPDLILGRKYKLGHWARGAVLQDRSKGCFEWVKVNDFRSQEWFLSPWIEPGCEHVDPDFARLTGYYLAEGCKASVRGKEIRLAFNINELDTLAADAASICKKLGYKVKVSKDKDFNGCRVSIYSKEFRSHCLANVGEGSKLKVLSDAVMRWNTVGLKNLLLGAVLGDGWIDPERGVKYLTSNFKLATQISTVMGMLRIRHNVSFHTKEKERPDTWPANWSSTVTEMYQVLVPREESEDLRQSLRPFLREKDLVNPTFDARYATGYSRDEGHLRRLDSKEKIDYTGYVYDLTVEDDITYIVAGVAVFDCPDFKYRWSWALKQRGSSRVGPNSMNQAWNKAPKITNPTSKVGLCVAEGELVSTDRGLVPIEKVTTSDCVWTLDGWRKVTASACTGIKQTVVVTLRSGKTVKVTPEHEVYAFSENKGFTWTPASALTSEHQLCNLVVPDEGSDFETLDVPEFLSSNKNIHYPARTIVLNETVAELLGYMVAEGSFTYFAGCHADLRADFRSKWTSVFGPKSLTHRDKGYCIGVHGSRMLAKIGFVCGSYTKEVPAWIMRASRSVKIAFLRGCYAGDGNFRNRQSTYGSVSEKLARGLQVITHTLGISTTLDCYVSGVADSDCWVVRTSSRDETEKLFSLLNPIRGYSTQEAKAGDAFHAQHFYAVNNARDLFRHIVDVHLSVVTDERVVALHTAKSEFKEFSTASVDDMACRLKGRLQSLRLRRGGKPHNAARVCDIFEAMRPYLLEKMLRELDIPKYIGCRMHRLQLKGTLSRLSRLIPSASDALKTLVREDLFFDRVSSVAKSDTVRVYDLTVEESEHFTVNGIVVHNCKHILAARDYIYGLVETFPGNEPDTAEKLNVLTKYAKKRWTDFAGQMAAAKERDKEFARQRALRNISGRLPEPKPAADAAASNDPNMRTDEPETRQEQPASKFSAAMPPKLDLKGTTPSPKKPTAPVSTPKTKQAPTPTPTSGLKKKPALKKDKNKQASGVIPPPFRSKAEQDFSRRQGLGDSLATSVVISNNVINMSKLNEAIKLVTEMEDDILKGGEDTGYANPISDVGDVNPAEPLEPSEPPISDSAIGADTEGDTALGLLRQMKDLLTQIATVVAPVEDIEGAEGEEGAEGAEGAAFGGMPPEPIDDEAPVDSEFAGKEDEEGEEDEGEEDFKEGDDDEEDEEAANSRPGK